MATDHTGIFFDNLYQGRNLSARIDRLSRKANKGQPEVGTR